MLLRRLYLLSLISFSSQNRNAVKTSLEKCLYFNNLHSSNPLPCKKEIHVSLKQNDKKRLLKDKTSLFMHFEFLIVNLVCKSETN